MKKMIIVPLLLLGVAGYAGEAVSGANGKVGFSAGNMNGFDGKNVTGSFAVPLGTNFGFQVDALYTDVSKNDFYGIGAHLFWRDSEKGLLGLTAGAIRENDVLDSWAAGVEGEYYLGNVTVSALGGFANIDYRGSPAPFIETDETDYYVSAEIGFYPMDDLLLSLSYSRAFDNGMVQGQLEYQTPLNGISFFADIAQGDNNYDHALVGLRYYFGQEKSLKLRHRQDDPPNILHIVMNTLGSYGAEFNRNAADYYAESGTSGSPGGYGDDDERAKPE